MGSLAAAASGTLYKLALYSALTTQLAGALTRNRFEHSYDFLENHFGAEKSLLPTVVRLGFHDCVGGCDGCVNLNNKDNAGLEVAVRELERIYQDHGFRSSMSRADFYALSCVAAVGAGIRAANEGCPRENEFCRVPPLNASFQWGRLDCESPNAPATRAQNAFPSPKMSADDMFGYFEKQFGLTPKETTALMGAHTLGGADLENSGYDGNWVAGEQFMFNNRFYSLMLDKAVAWTKVDVSASAEGEDPKWQWDGYYLSTEKKEKAGGDKAGMMFNTDFELLYELQSDAETGEPGCSVQPGDVTCTRSRRESSGAAARYAKDNAEWIWDFSKALTKMLSNGASSLKDLEDE